MERLENFKLQLIIVMVAQLLAAIILFMCGLQQIALIVAGVVIVNILIVIWIMARMEKEKKDDGPGYLPRAGKGCEGSARLWKDRPDHL